MIDHLASSGSLVINRSVALLKPNEVECRSRNFAQFTEFHHQMRDWETHIQLQDDLVEHTWTHVDNQ
jgi:hypothetical protein